MRPGDYGTINTKRVGAGVFESSARYRRHDGSMQRAWAQGPSRSAAESNLKARIRERLGDIEGELSADSTVAELAKRWLASRESQRTPLAPRTLESLRHAVDGLVVPLLGSLTVRECNAPRIERTVLALLASDAPSNAGRLRWALSGMFSMAVRLGAVEASPVPHTSKYVPEKPRPKALTLEDLVAVRAVVRSQPEPRTNRRAGASAADVLEFLVATGCRASEALGLQWEDVHLEDSIPWVRIHRQVVRVKGAGLVLTPTKEHDVRMLALPSFAVEMLRRIGPAAAGTVFPSATGGLRDPRNMRGIWDRALAGTEWEWVTQKVIRKTVATYLADALGSKAAAEQLGHADDRVTRAHYIEARRTPLSIEAMAGLGPQ
jgi:integrase